MPALSVRNLGVTFVERVLFSGVSFDVESRDKVGFIGANGVGKTTLFRVLNGELSPTEGTVAFEKNTRVGYMEQHACRDPEVDVYHELLSVFDYLAQMESDLAVLNRRIARQPENIDALIEEQMRLIEEHERLGGLTYKSRTRSALLGLGFTERRSAQQAVFGKAPALAQQFAAAGRADQSPRYSVRELAGGLFARLQGRDDHHQPRPLFSRQRDQQNH